MYKTKVLGLIFDRWTREGANILMGVSHDEDNFLALRRSDPEVEGGDEVWGLCDDVLELAGRQLLIIVNVSLKQNLKKEKTTLISIFYTDIGELIQLFPSSLLAIEARPKYVPSPSVVQER